MEQVRIDFPEESQKLDEQTYEKLKICFNILENSYLHSDYTLKFAEETKEQIMKDILK
ncbi:hypothetical protein [Oceanobacillus senegalensis]|uniref:hypothetical protein n=1 Tax=Oceanobacillus senegalensis TaxID=1936063 RepID=UPI0015C451A8|nr:hypothetical protein [Oceanobacillus senegalensis]